MNREAERAEAHRAEVSRQQRLVSGRAILRDALSYERPSQRMRMLRNYDDMPDFIPIADAERSTYSEVLQRPVESETRGATREETESRLRSPPPLYMPTPPYSFDESSGSTSNRLTPPSHPTDQTPRYLPAQLERYGNEPMEDYIARVSHLNTHHMMLDEITRTRQEVERTREEVRRTREEASRTWREMDRTLFESLDDLPSPPRMGRRPREPVPMVNPQPLGNSSGLDGLGDRRRSFSPEDDAWDTLLTTITPDERIPSVHSSFTSATASASASVAPNPPTSTMYETRGTRTVPSSASNADIYSNLCDGTDTEDSLTEDESATMATPGAIEELNDMLRDGPATSFIRPPPIYSRRYHHEMSDRAEQLASQRRPSYTAIEREPQFNVHNPGPLEQAAAPDMPYEDRYRRNRLRHLRATEMGSERSSGVRPARERL